MSKLFSGKLISNITKFKHDQGGQALVMVAVALVVILGMMALTVDVGALALEKGRLQNACDAAALAGAREAYATRSEESDDSRESVRNEAKTFLEENGAKYEVDNVDLNTSDKTVTVSASNSVNYAFAKVLGISSGTVNASATAIFGTVKNIKGKTGVIGGASPIGISEKMFKSGAAFEVNYELVSAKNNEIIGPGNFGFVALGGTGENNLEQNFLYGYKGTVGNEVKTEPGNLGGPSESALLSRLCKHVPHCTPEEYEHDCPSLLTVIILKEGSLCGREDVEVVGFAMFLLTYVGKNKDNDKVVRGTFVKYNTPENSEYVIDPDGEDFGLVASRLIK